jgi:adenylate cyclase class 2
MLEIEMKFPLVDFAPLEKTLAAWGARPEAPCDNADHYLNAPDRDFAVTDEALRLRRVGSSNRVTYKGPKRATQAKVRTEIEVGLAEGEQAAEDFLRLLTSLGYKPVAVVKKHRRSFHLNREGYDLEVTLDEVEGLGRFAEVEILAPEDGLPAASAALQRVADGLGLGKSERRSYLEMFLEKQGGKSA